MTINNNKQRHDREFAWRIFAGEYNRSTLEMKDSDERAPGYIVTPLGAKINRLFIVGVLTELEKLDRNGKIYYRARISDRTGTFFIYAGQFDPNVMKVLSSLEPPVFVAVVGKSRLFSPSEGVNYVSIRPENIIEVDKHTRDYWLLDASQNMKQRLEANHEVNQLEEPSLENIKQLGYLPELAAGILDARKHYKDIKNSIPKYREMLIDVLKFLVLENGVGYINSQPEQNLNIQEFTSEFKTGDEIKINAIDDDGDSDLEFELDPELEKDSDNELEIVNEVPELEQKQEQLVEVLKTFQGKKYTDGIPWHELVAKADDNGMDKLYIEDVVNSLLENGRVYEPMLGKLKLMNC